MEQEIIYIHLNSFNLLTNREGKMDTGNTAIYVVGFFLQSFYHENTFYILPDCTYLSMQVEKQFRGLLRI